jgi:hypothetical protein
MLELPTLYSGHDLCTGLVPKEVCFCVRKYKEGVFETVYHVHVPAYRLSTDSGHEALRSFVAQYSGWPSEWFLHSLLNNRSGKPQRYPGFTCDVGYPEPGVLRHTVRGTNVHAWCDRVIAKRQFRPSACASDVGSKP